MKKVKYFTLLVFLFVTTTTFSQQKEAVVESKQNHVSSQSDQPVGVRKITGKVTDEEGEALPGVTVKIKGKSVGTITDVNGYYELNNVPVGSILEFSFVGMENTTQSVGKQSVIDIMMHMASKELEELTVIGYGSIRKSDLTGSVASINSEDLSAGMNSSLDNALAGKLPGVQVTQISGMPGSGASIRVRGTNSLTANNQPLYVIDDVPYEGGGGAGGLDVGGIGNGISPLSQINISDIESIEVLKDASSTAIYGSRGSNGVVLITTKRGSKDDKSIISYDASYGVQQISRKIPLTNSMQYGELVNDYFVSQGQAPVYSNIDSLGIGTDWQNLLLRTGNVQNHSLSVSGGNKKTQYLVSLGYMDIKGIVVNSYFNRYTLRANIDTKLTNWLKVGNSISVVRSDGNVTSSGESNNNGVISQALTSRPTTAFKDPNGQYTIYQENDPTALSSNPVANQLAIINYDLRNRVFGNVYGQIDISKNLSFKSTFGYDLTNSTANYYAPRTVAIGLQKNGYAKVGNANSVYWNSTNLLTFNKDFNRNNRLTMLAGASWEKRYSESSRIEAQDFVTDALLFHNASSGAIQQTYSGASDWTLQSYFGRFNYSLYQKYLFTLTGRIDGSSRFGAKNKYAFFPSFAFAWRASEEKFLAESSWISNLKVRLSAGESGEQAIPSYGSLSTLSSVPVAMGTSIYTGFVPTRMANEDLKWERTNQLNAGFDFGIWKNRVTFTADAYYKRTDDLLYNITIPVVSGFSTSIMNVGKIENKGIEFLVNVVPIDKIFKWDFTLNLSSNRNKVLALSKGMNEIIAPSNSAHSSDLKANPSLIRVGEPVGVFYGYVFNGIFQNADDVAASPVQTGAVPGELKIKDISGPDGIPDGKITTDDQTIIGNPNPDWIGGFINHFSYKRFDLNANFQWTVGGDIYSFQNMYLTNVNSRRNILLDFYKNHWTAENPNNHTPGINYNARTYPNNSYFIYDGTFLRCSNITLSYNLPINNRIKSVFQAIKVYLSVDNLFTLTNYLGFNPDISAFGDNSLASGVDMGVYPTAKTYRIGLNVQF